MEHSKEAEIIVADNASTDQSVSVLKNQFPTVRLIELEQNYGFCGGYNRALKQVEAEYYVLLNSDVEVTAQWLDPIITLLDQDATIAAVQPKILAYHQPTHFEYAGAGGGFIDALGYPFCRGRLFDVTEADTGQYNDVREVFWATGACLVVRARVYNQLRGLDEDFFAHMEEIDLCWRIQRVGLKVYYCGNSTIYHVGGGTLAHTNPRKTYLNFRNGLALLYKHWSTTALIFKFPLRMFLDHVGALRYLLGGQPGDARAVIRAHYHFLRSLRRSIRKRSSLRQYPFTTKNVYAGSVIWQHFVRKRQKIDIG